MKFLFELIAFILCFWGILSSTQAQSEPIPVTKHCSKDSLYHFHFLEEESAMLWTGKRDLKYTVTDMSPQIDTFCLKKIIEILNLNKKDPKKSFSIYILYFHYQDAYRVLNDTLILQTITNTLRYGQALYRWGDVSVREGKFYAGRYGRLLLHFGKQAIPYLTDILQDNEQVYDYQGPNSGGEQTHHYAMYEFRRKDLAYFYLSNLLGQPITFRYKPYERDKIIQEFIEKYRKELYIK